MQNSGGDVLARGGIKCQFAPMGGNISKEKWDAMWEGYEPKNNSFDSNVKEARVSGASVGEDIRANNCPDDIRIYLDICSDERLDEVGYIRDCYLPTAEIFRATEHLSAPSGCWNILNSIKQGYQTGSDYVFLIEEDVMVFPDYFDWSLQTHSEGDYFATCGRLRKEHFSSYYTNPGACFSRAGLKHLIPYINDRYFANRRQYLDLHFGEMPEASDLDDGLIRRVIRAGHLAIKYPDTPKVAHQGFHFFNQFAEFKTAGPIQERIYQLRKMLSSISPEGRYTKDFEPGPDESTRKKEEIS